MAKVKKPKDKKSSFMSTVFVRGQDKEELEIYTKLKQRWDEKEDSARQNESSDSDTNDSDELNSDCDSD